MNSFQALADFTLLAEVVETFLGMAAGDTELMAVDEAGSTEVGSGLNPEAAQFERDVTYRATHAVQTKIAPDAEGAWE